MNRIAFKCPFPSRPILRRIAARSASALAAATLLLCSTAVAESAEPVEQAGSRPNVVLFLVDDMGYGDAGCYNPESKIKTPHIDRLAREGMRFTDAHAAGAVCVPSRYGLLTGRYAFRGKLNWRRSPAIAQGTPTVANMLRDRGYATAMIGKWHLGFEGGPDYEYGKPLRGGPVDRGFDSYFGIPHSLDITPYFYIKDRKAVAAPTEKIGARNTPGWTPIQGEFWRAGGIAPGFKHKEVLPRFAEEAVAWLDGHGAAGKKKPFFLYVALTAPHTPWLPLDKYKNKSRAGMYGDFMLQVDDTFGDVLSALHRNGFAENTIVIFTSDNGPVWYPQDVKRLGHASNGPLRGMKADAWEGGHRVPFIVRWPGRVKADAVNRSLVSFVDLYATLAELTGKLPEKGVAQDSISFLPALLGKENPAARETLVLKQNASALRRGRWKLITHLGSGGFSQPRRIKAEPGGPTGQLYDLEADLGEQNNLWSKRPDLVEKLRNTLEAARGAAR